MKVNDHPVDWRAVRAYKGVRLITGRAPAARSVQKYKKDYEPRAFLASFGGNCRGCGMRFQQGDPIVSDGKGRGAMHPKCHPTRRKKGMFG